VRAGFNKEESGKEIPLRERQVGGDHYKKHKIQPWDIIDEYNLNFYAGNVIKYMLRDKEDEDGLEALYKARHYLEKLISNVEEACRG